MQSTGAYGKVIFNMSTRPGKVRKGLRGTRRWQKLEDIKNTFTSLFPLLFRYLRSRIRFK